MSTKVQKESLRKLSTSSLFSLLSLILLLHNTNKVLALGTKKEKGNLD